MCVCPKNDHRQDLHDTLKEISVELKGEKMRSEMERNELKQPNLLEKLKQVSRKSGPVGWETLKNS